MHLSTAQVQQSHSPAKGGSQSHVSNRKPAEGQEKIANGNEHATERPLSTFDLGGGFIQRKLTVGAPDDPLEQEADHVADKIMRMPLSEAVVTGVSDPSQLLRKCAACEDEEKIQRKPMAISNALQPKVHAQAGPATAAVSQRIAATRGGGSSLDHAARSIMEHGFGRDFAAVRIHTGPTAAALNHDLGARAFTVGNDIYFNDGQYNPLSHNGRHLLAHELTHTVQQGGGIQRSLIQRACGEAEIGVPTGCGHVDTAAPERPRYLFDVNCDTFATGNELDLRKDAETYENGDVIEIHGLASEEGSATFNENLSCARAFRAQAVIQEVLSTRGITASIYVFNHGASEGDHTTNRAVAIVRKGAPTPPTNTPAPPPKDPYYNPVPGPNECDDVTYCTPYATAAEIADARAYLLGTFVPLLGIRFGSDVETLWRDFVNRKRGDSLAPRIFDTPGNSIWEAFSTNSYIADEVEKVLDLIASRLSRGYGNVTQPLDNFIESYEKRLSTNFANPQTIPGNIAGGIGGSDAGPDLRKITWGTVSFDVTNLPFGKKVVNIEAFVNFEVKDAIDFCPGSCGAWLEKTLATLKLSRLEASGEAYDVPFIVRFPGPRLNKRVID